MPRRTLWWWTWWIAGNFVEAVAFPSLLHAAKPTFHSLYIILNPGRTFLKSIWAVVATTVVDPSF